MGCGGSKQQFKEVDLGLPDLELPDLELPDLELPDLELPDLELQDLGLPDPELPRDPDLELPERADDKLPNLGKVSPPMMPGGHSRNKACQQYGLWTEYPGVRQRPLLPIRYHQSDDLRSGTSSRPSKDSPEPLSDSTGPLDLRNFPAIPEFIGRQEILNGLWNCFSSAGNSPMRKVAVLYGLGGIGKTQLAIHFARLHQNHFTRIFLVNGKSQKTLVDSLAEIEIPDSPVDPVNDVQKKAERVLRWLTIKGNSRWLLIFDGVDQYTTSKINNEEAYDVNSYFPTADHGSIIITTRLRKLQELGQPFLVPKLNVEETMLLMKDIGHTPEEKQDIRTLAFLLDGLPLAISLASSYISGKGIEVSKYLHHYSESWRAFQEPVIPHRQYSNGNLATTWMSSYNAIRKIDNSYPKFLVLLSHFSHQDIRFELVQNALKFSRIPDWLHKIASDEQGFLNAIEALMDFCFIERGGNGSFLMHPVVQTWCRNIDDIDKDELRTIALISIRYFIPDPTTSEYCELQQRLLLHADEIYPFFQHGWELPPDDQVLEAAHKIAALYKNQAEFDKAEVIYKSVLRGREEALGFNDVSTLDTVSQLGFVYHKQGKLENAEKMYTRALSNTHIFTPDTGSNQLFTLRNANNLGVLYMNQNKLQKAEGMYKLARSGYERVPGSSHLHSLDTISNLGLLRRAQGNLREAEPLLQQALEGREEALGPDHTSTLDALNNLGTLYLDQDNLEKAESMFGRALDGREQTLGSNHTSTLDTVHNLGHLYQKRGKLELAESKYKRALKGREEALGSDHTSTLETVDNMGNLYMEQRKWDDAKSMYQRALRGRKTVLGPDHLSTLATINNMAILYKNWGKLNKAETWCRQALSGYETALGFDHITTLDIINNIGRIHSSRGNMDAAEKMYQKALNGYEKKLGQSHASTLNAVNNLGNVYLEQDKLKEAEGMYRRVVSSGKLNLEVLQAVGNLGVIHERQGKLDEAKKIYLQELKGIEEVLSKDHQEARMVKEKLRILKRKKRWKRLKSLFRLK
ncbi:hypothetical protein Egran_00714 [Elaphomyces granulatus]|uniref:Uncharacterized protein n=1 Tax=Elaphomyces granulatus TaxID=519963 RepID=A0A232M523_9EURO|nr:hypothetical protein Egran_00714 [Elaphomyces granulatus]